MNLCEFGVRKVSNSVLEIIDRSLKKIPIQPFWLLNQNRKIFFVFKNRTVKKLFVLNFYMVCSLLSRSGKWKNVFINAIRTFNQKNLVTWQKKTCYWLSTATWPQKYISIFSSLVVSKMLSVWWRRKDDFGKQKKYEAETGNNGILECCVVWKNVWEWEKEKKEYLIKNNKFFRMLWRLSKNSLKTSCVTLSFKTLPHRHQHAVQVRYFFPRAFGFCHVTCNSLHSLSIRWAALHACQRNERLRWANDQTI